MEALQLQDIPQDERLDVLDRALEQGGKEQEQELLVDFDEAYEEYKKKETPLVVKFMGELFEVPRKRPTNVMLFTARNQKDGMLPDDKYYEMLEMILGKRFIQRLEETNAPLDFVTETVMNPITEKWGVKGTGYKKK